MSGQAPTRTLEAAQRLWQTALGELEIQLTRATYNTWLRGSRVIAFQDDTITVYVQHAYAVDWLENRLSPVILRTLQRQAGPQISVVFTTQAPKPDERLRLVPEQVEPDPPAPSEGRAASVQANGNGRPSSIFTQRYTFDTFVVGASNRLAHAASLAVAENPAHAYNPLFIHGGAGLGKTHLLRALGHSAQQQGLSALYVSSEWFTNDLIEAIRAQDTPAFRAKYRSHDILLVDDVQFIAGKESTQEEFFHTFNTLHHAGKQIVVSCDRPPKALVALENRLRSRFGWGLIADIQPPDYETRIAILQAKLDGISESVPNEVLAYIARKVPVNIRELEGALNSVLAHTRLMNAPLDLASARAALESILSRQPELSPDQIVSAVAEHYQLSVEQLTGRSRARAVSVPRQLAMYLIREETDTSLPTIGQILGGRDHTTIMHGCRKTAARIETEESFRREWLAVKQRLAATTKPRRRR
jgi:chromosomal replication initiator protein